MKRQRRSTPPGQHRPVLLDEVLSCLAPAPGEVVADCTTGWAGHSCALLQRIGPTGRLVGLDLDAGNFPRAQERLAALGHPFALHHANFAGLPGVLAGERVDAVLADLGMSSMQVDDPERGFSYVRDGPLDMRMDRSRGRSAAELLSSIAEADLARALRELGDEPQAEVIARAVVKAREQEPLTRTAQLSELIRKAVLGDGRWELHPSKEKWNTHPAARTFQVLRILVNRELANLEQLLRVLPEVLRPGGRAAVISFHSGEDRLVKNSFRAGLHSGVYSDVSADPVRASFHERNDNPRSRSAKLRWARRSACLDGPNGAVENA
jgi:16S rRNA (cytosine1402-N4)-methyltransferase